MMIQRCGANAACSSSASSRAPHHCFKAGINSPRMRLKVANAHRERTHVGEQHAFLDRRSMLALSAVAPLLLQGKAHADGGE
jgi:hypothetical protein